MTRPSLSGGATGAFSVLAPTLLSLAGFSVVTFLSAEHTTRRAASAIVAIFMFPPFRFISTRIEPLSFSHACVATDHLLPARYAYPEVVTEKAIAVHF